MGGNAHPVFVGTVLQVTPVSQTGRDSFLSVRKARIRVDESFGGLAAGVREVDVLTGAGGGDCGINFRAGEVYLVDASTGSDGFNHAGICSATRRIEAAGAALRILRQRRDGKKVPSLSGQVWRYTRNFEGPGGRYTPRPLPRTWLRLRANGRVFKTLSDKTGLYEFYDLPPGQYEFAPDLVPGTTLAWYLRSDQLPIRFDGTGHGCQERNVDLFDDGSIQGRVLDSANQLLHYATVFILPANAEAIPNLTGLYGESQGEKGFYKFVHMPPGRYLLFVSPGDSQEMTFYPGVRSRASATVITVQPGQKILDADIHLKQNQ